MIPYNKKARLIFLIVWLATTSSYAQQDLLNYDNTLKFARYLLNTRQYTFASQEYERMHFLWPEDTTVLLEMVRTYRLSQDCSKFDRALQLLSLDHRINSNPDFTREYLRFCLTCNIEHPLYADLLSGLDPKDRDFYSLSYLWANQKYDSAFSYNNRHAESLRGNFRELYDLTVAFEQQRYKKPMLALAMSAVLPGSGKAYSKRWGDASISLLFVASSAFASYRAFKQKGIKSINGWIFGGVALSFYSSNLYGSYKSAKNYNETLRIRYQNNAEQTIHHSF